MISPMSTDEVWAAGFMSAMGGFVEVTTNGEQVVRYAISTISRRESIMRLADIAQANVSTVEVKSGGELKTSYKISMQGKPLHNLMTKVWGELTIDRKREYSNLRKKVKANG